jgi:hypothetical protein
MWKKVVAVLLVIPVAGLIAAVVKWDDLGLDKQITVVSPFVGQVIAGFIGFGLLGLANYLWTGKTADERDQERK